MALTPRFTALVRWRGPDPSIEIETRHSGFDTPEDAALFANAFSPDAPLSLRLAARSSLQLLKADGHYVEWPTEGVTVWVLPPVAAAVDDLVVASDEDFEPYRFADLSIPTSALGDYEQGQYAVLDGNGSPVDVVVDWDETDHLRVTVRWDATDANDVQLVLSSVLQP